MADKDKKVRTEEKTEEKPEEKKDQGQEKRKKGPIRWFLSLFKDLDSAADQRPLRGVRGILAALGLVSLGSSLEEIFSFIFGAGAAALKGGTEVYKHIIDPALRRIAMYFRVGAMGLTISLIIGTGAFVLYFGGLSGKPMAIMLLTIFFLVWFIIWAVEQAARVIVPSIVPTRNQEGEENQAEEVNITDTHWRAFLGLMALFGIITVFGLLLKWIGLMGWWLAFLGLSFIGLGVLLAGTVVLNETFSWGISYRRFIRNILIAFASVMFFAFFASLSSGAVVQVAGYLFFISAIFFVVSAIPLYWVGYYFYKNGFDPGKYGGKVDTPTIRHYMLTFFKPFINFLFIATALVLFTQYFKAWQFAAAMMANVVLAVIAMYLAGLHWKTARVVNNFFLVAGVIFFLTTTTAKLFYHVMPSGVQEDLQKSGNVALASADNYLQEKSYKNRKPGDINGNGKYDDLPFIKDIVNGKLAVAEEIGTWADVNDDGSRDTGDVILYAYADSTKNWALLKKPTFLLEQLELAKKPAVTTEEEEKAQPNNTETKPQASKVDTLIVSANHPFPVSVMTPKGPLRLSMNDEDIHRQQGCWSDNSGFFIVYVFRQSDGTLRLEAKGEVTWINYRGYEKKCGPEGTPWQKLTGNYRFDFTPANYICPSAYPGALVAEWNGTRFLVGKSKVIG